jgi:tetratricopeptide (TPR) repeat protein
MAGISLRDKNWRDAADTAQRALKLDPFDFPQAYLFSAIANYNLKNLDAAEKSAREGQKIDTQHRYPKLEHVLGVLLAEKQDFPAAAEHMRSYLKFAPEAQDAGIVKKQLTEIEKLSSAGKLTTGPASAPEPRQ